MGFRVLGFKYTHGVGYRVQGLQVSRTYFLLQVRVSRACRGLGTKVVGTYFLVCVCGAACFGYLTLGLILLGSRLIPSKPYCPQPSTLNPKTQ